jgi:hypothetical protein
MTPPTFLITCSCRRTTHIRWAGRCYEADKPEWDAAWPTGWTCGRPNHTQQVPPAIAVPTIPALQKITL